MTASGKHRVEKKPGKPGGVVVGKECIYLFSNNKAWTQAGEKKAAVVVSALNCALFKQEESLPLKKKHFYHSQRSQGSPFKMRYFLNKIVECFPAGNEHLIP